MDEYFQKIAEFAEQGRFDEARRFIQESDLSEAMKARYNMSINQLEFQKATRQSPQPDIPKLPVISMILGFLLICAAFFFNGDIQTVMLVSGLVMAGAIPAYYCFREKKAADRLTKPRDSYAKMYTDKEADINFPWQVPSAGVIITTILGVVLIFAAMFFADTPRETASTAAALVLLISALIVFAVSRWLAKSFNGFLMWAAIAVSFLFFTASVAVADVTLSDSSVSTALLVIGSLVLLLYPLEYILIKKAVCSEEVEAQCVDVHTILSRRDLHPRYHAIWMYEFNGMTYIHKDFTVLRMPELGERRLIRISPRSPHNIHAGKLPHSAWLMSAAGFFALVLSLVSM